MSLSICLLDDTDMSSDYQDQVWIWENEEGTFYFDVGEIVRFRVEMEEWHDQIPNAPDLGDGPAIDRKPPYSIIVRSLHYLFREPFLTNQGSMQMAGLGPTSWW